MYVHMYICMHIFLVKTRIICIANQKLHKEVIHYMYMLPRLVLTALKRLIRHSLISSYILIIFFKLNFDNGNSISVLKKIAKLFFLNLQAYHIHLYFEQVVKNFEQSYFRVDYTQRNFFKILLNQTDTVPLIFQISQKNGKYNLISVCFNKILKKFLCVYTCRFIKGTENFNSRKNVAQV